MKMRPGQKQDGLSLLEMVIAMAISLIILAAISTTFIAQRRVYDTQEQKIEMIQTARAALDMISREIMMAGYDPTGNLQRENDTASDYTGIVYHADKLEIRADLDGDGIIVKNDSADPTDPETWEYDDDGPDNGANERIVYKLEGDLLRRKTKAGFFQPFAENIKEFSIRYLDGNVSDTTDSSSIRQVEITVEVKTEEPAMGSGFRTEKLVSVVEVRNMGLEPPSSPGGAGSTTTSSSTTTSTTTTTTSTSATSSTTSSSTSTTTSTTTTTVPGCVLNVNLQACKPDGSNKHVYGHATVTNSLTGDPVTGAVVKLYVDDIDQGEMDDLGNGEYGGNENVCLGNAFESSDIYGTNWSGSAKATAEKPGCTTGESDPEPVP